MNKFNKFPKPQISAAQSIVLKNIGWVKQLPFSKQRRLEAEMMELILNAELKSKGTVRLCPAIKQLVEREYEDFLQNIELKEIFLLNCGINDDEVEKDKKLGHALESNEFLPEALKITGDIDLCDDTSSCSNLTIEEVAEFEVVPIREQEKPKPIAMPRLEKHLVRPCVVRIKRLKLNVYGNVISIARN